MLSGENVFSPVSEDANLLYLVRLICFALNVLRLSWNGTQERLNYTFGMHAINVRIRGRFMFNFRRVHIVAKGAYMLRQFRLSAFISTAPAGRIFVKFDTMDVHENLSVESKLC